MFWHPWIRLFLLWSRVDRLGAPVRELLAHELRRIKHVSWIINSPDYEYLPVVQFWFPGVVWTEMNTVVPVCLVSKFSLLKASMTVPQRQISCPLIGQNSFAPGAVPLLSYITSFHINISYFGLAASMRFGASGDAPGLSRGHCTLTTWRLTLEGKGNHGMYPCVRGGSWCHWARMRWLMVWCHWAPLPIHDGVWAKGLSSMKQYGFYVNLYSLASFSSFNLIM